MRHKILGIPLILGLSLVLGVVPVGATDVDDEVNSESVEDTKVAGVIESVGETDLGDDGGISIEQQMQENNNYYAIDYESFDYKVTKISEYKDGKDVVGAYYKIEYKLPKIKDDFGNNYEDSVANFYSDSSVASVDEKSLRNDKGEIDLSNVLIRFSERGDFIFTLSTQYNQEYVVKIEGVNYVYEDGYTIEDDYKEKDDTELKVTVSKLPKKGSQIHPFKIKIKSNIKSDLTWNNTTYSGKKEFSVEVSENGTYYYTVIANNGKYYDSSVVVDSFKDIPVGGTDDGKIHTSAYTDSHVEKLAQTDKDDNNIFYAVFGLSMLSVLAVVIIVKRRIDYVKSHKK